MSPHWQAGVHCSGSWSDSVFKTSTITAVEQGAPGVGHEVVLRLPPKMPNLLKPDAQHIGLFSPPAVIPGMFGAGPWSEAARELRGDNVTEHAARTHRSEAVSTRLPSAA